MDIIKRESFEDAIRIGNLPMNGIASILMKIMKIDQINKLYDKYQDEKGLAFVDAVLDYLNIKIDINEQDVKNIPL
ncbi:MAG: GNAT family N-acetyltransferase, partial [Sphingobacteriaceae bacterium]